MIEFIAGKDAGKYDTRDWPNIVIPVYLNPDNVPRTTPIYEVGQMIRLACFSWTLRSHHILEYRGLTPLKAIDNAMVINYTSTDQLMSWYGSEVNGLCRSRGDKMPDGKLAVRQVEIYINGDTRPLANRFARATLKHEFGHGLGIAGHNDEPGTLMYKSSMGNENITLTDCQMLDKWNPYPIELNFDMSLSCPAVQMPDGHVKWLHLKYTGNALSHTWEIGSELPWQGPRLGNVTIGGSKEFNSQSCQYIHMRQVKSIDLSVRADLLLAPNGTLILEYAE